MPLEAASTKQVLEDAWVLVPAFQSGLRRWLVGCGALGLNRAKFRDICVFSAVPVSKRYQLIHNTPFVVTHAPVDKHFGTKPIWKQEKRILISDPAKTIVDMLSNPWVGGGIQHVVDCLKEYFKRDDCNERQLIEYAEVGNGALFKRLGFLVSRLLGDKHPLTAVCEAHLSQGNAQLDPALRGKKRNPLAPVCSRRLTD